MLITLAPKVSEFRVTIGGKKHVFKKGLQYDIPFDIAHRGLLNGTMVKAEYAELRNDAVAVIDPLRAWTPTTPVEFELKQALQGNTVTVTPKNSRKSRSIT